MVMKNIISFLILILIILQLSCNERDMTKSSNYFFKVSESEMGITTSKRFGAEFFVMFSKDSARFSDSVDYLQYKTGDMSEVNIVIDPKHKMDIYICETEYLKKVHPVKYKLNVLEKSKFYSTFFYPGIKNTQLVLKYPFVYVGIFTSTYGIFIERSDGKQKWIKHGDIEGGW